MNRLQMDPIIHTALIEDLGAGDVTTDALASETEQSKVTLLVKQSGVVAGMPVAKRTFQLLDDNVIFTPLCTDGDQVEAGTPIAHISGTTRALLSGERVALNFMQRMSGIASETRKIVDLVEGLGCAVLDTRKTTPGLRPFEKYAVRMGGGVNHRYGLSHGAMLKDNHIAMAGSIAEAVHRVRARNGHMVNIEVEADTLEQVKEIVNLEVDAILLDNMDIATLKEAVTWIDGRVWTEASGGLTPETVRAVAQTGVDAISLGWLTHSAPALDISLDWGTS
ncbi:carboxylating nicotinate-nucleotide diphosphorylase [Mechercharimyces sp. CAU 1602]|uniref:carboxylating nicotinate-nucleotide diphosphorylase n=1 Tax=Mechercharimyces sp. CAU 1602 TaxID=2973933 RepID=UPI00216299A1|nr:carboxylating nicotinate-nucleotide diphosphorylase [Mechercharimyces sp. CAU 1602]MCS1350009.1 carboxylating nicotinate-nucleotide diphosphorylase [Mechercharimyces sp. CAU 1602]